MVLSLNSATGAEKEPYALDQDLQYVDDFFFFFFFFFLFDKEK